MTAGENQGRKMFRQFRQSFTVSAAGALTIILLSAVGTSAFAYSPPFVVPAPNGTISSNYGCTTTSVPAKSLYLTSRYKPDGSYDIVDPELEAAYNKSVQNVNRFLSDASTHSNRYIRSNGSNISAANCARSMLLKWAQADALSEIGGNAGWFKLSTTHSGASMIFHQIKGTGGQSTRSADTQIATWLAKRADILRYYRDNTFVTGTARNNHLYWAGLAIGSVGAITNDSTNFNWGMKALETGACSVGKNDLLPEELKRGKLSLHYSAYALQPLIMLAELAERNKRSGYALCENGIVRLVKRVLWIAPVPSRMENYVQIVQDPIMTEGAALPTPLWSWIVPYSRRYSVWSQWEGRMAITPRIAAIELGGDMRVLYPN